MAMKINEKRFAKIDKSMFEASIVDTGIAINNLQNANNYISMREIISQATHENLRFDKNLFKLRSQPSNSSAQE